MTHLSPIVRAAKGPLFRAVFALAFIVAAAGSARVEAQKTATAPPNQAAGAPAGSYPLSGFEQVNLFSGNLNFNLPLAEVGGRGGVKVPISLSTNSSGKWGLSRFGVTGYALSGANFTYTVSLAVVGERDIIADFTSGGGNIWSKSYTQVLLFTVDYGTITSPTPDPMANDNPYHIENGPQFTEVNCPGPTFNCFLPGQGFSYGPGGLSGKTEYWGGSWNDNNPQQSVPGRSLTRLTFSLSDGTQFELRDAGTGGMAHDANTPGNWQGTQVYDRGRVFVTVDGNSATFVSDTDVTEQFDYFSGNGRYVAVSGYLLLADGTRYRIDNGHISWLRDRNGNLTTFSYDAGGRVVGEKDSLGRSVTILYQGVTDPATGVAYDHDEIRSIGAGGQPRTVKVWHGHLSDALVSGTTQTVQHLFPAWELDDQTSVYDPDNVVSAVELPDHRRYEMRYNAYGDLARVTLPTGGKIEYDYVTIGSSMTLNRCVSERRVYRDAADATPELRQVYDYDLNQTTAGQQRVNVEQRSGADNRLLSYESHYFYGLIGEGDFGLYNSWNEGKELKTETYDIDPTGDHPTNLLRKVEYNWQPRLTPGWFPAGSSAVAGPAFDPRVVETTTTLEDGSVSKQTSIDPQSDPQNPVFGFDRFNNPTDLWEYGFDGALVRHMQTAYKADDDSYTGGLWDIGSNPDPATILASAHLRSLPTRKSVFDAGGKERARTTYEYDDYAPDTAPGNRHAVLVSHDLPIFGLCLTFNIVTSQCDRASDANYLTRGNVTGTTSYLLDKDGNATGSVTANQQYDIAGNVVKSIDARTKPGQPGAGYETKFDFSDDFGSSATSSMSNNAPQELGSQYQTYALPTLVTNALGQTAQTQYDYYTGRAVKTLDANGTMSSVTYGDLLDRPTKVERDINSSSTPSLRSQTTFAYDDTNRTITTTGDLNTYGDNLVKSEVLYDGLGRTTEARQYETSSQYVSKQTQYDALGRASQVSNPFRPTLGETAVWTTTAYDALGRVSSVTTPDNATVYTFYDGVRTMVTDQAGKQRISKTDALGRLSDVWEVTAADSATEAVSFPVPQNFPYVPANGYHTGYGYDVLGNLRKVDQVGQQRYFSYDSLSRLVRAKNPEQDALAATSDFPALTDYLTQNGQWSSGYSYDESGNLTKRTDARGVVTSYVYDALGRVTTRSYSDGTTPQVNYYYDNQTLPPGAPAFTRGKSVGQLVAVTYGVSSAAGSYTGGYDELGRAHYSSQVTAAPDSTGQVVSRTYTLGYDYYLDGRLKTETYPSGKVVETQYDSAGRVAGVKDQVTGQYYAGGDPGVANNQNVISYSSSGAVTDMRLGNGLWEHTSLNNRLQPEHVYLGTAKGGNNVLGLDYTYGTTDNNGNVKNQTITAPAYNGDAAFTATQTYSYDSLNRLSSAFEVSGAQETWRQTYTYDRYGNRQLDETQTRKLNGAGAMAAAIDDTNRSSLNPTVNASTNRISQAGYSFDPAGNLLCDTMHPCSPAPALTPYFAYDGENHMTKAGGGTQAGGADYSYDGGGQRVAKLSGSQVTVFVYDAGGKLVAEYSNQVSYNGASYLTQDTLGSTRVVTDKDGRVVSRHDYQPFGEEIDSIALPRTGREALQSYNYGMVRQKFTGYEKDTETGLDFAKARYYANAQARFTSPDPLPASAHVNSPQTLNRYAYVLNNPLNSTDPTGMCPPNVQCEDQGTPNEHYVDPETKDIIYSGTSHVLAAEEAPTVSVRSVVNFVTRLSSATRFSTIPELGLDGDGGGGEGGGGGGSVPVPEWLAGPSAEYPSTDSNISLGLDPHYNNLANQTGALPWRSWFPSLTSRNPLYSPFGRVFFPASNNAEGIHFALDGLESQYSYEGVFSYGSRGFIPRPGPWGDSNMTNAEFFSIYTNKGLFYKTQFYFRGNGTIYQPVDPPRPFGWRPPPFTFK
jgi:RHS repeat-associated protein